MSTDDAPSLHPGSTLEEVDAYLRRLARAVADVDPIARATAREQAKRDLNEVEAVSAPSEMVSAALNGRVPDGPIPDEEEPDADPADLLERGREILEAEDQLALFRSNLQEAGFAGATEAAELVHVALCSRALERPIGLAIHGPSAAGKSFTFQVARQHHPEDAVEDISAMSERFLAYADFPTEHRYVSISEAAALHRDGVGATIIRELSWNRRLRYGTVIRTEDGPQAKTIERPGPTGLVTTTTKDLDPEIATRLLALQVTDAPEHTKDILDELARQAEGEHRADVDLEPWHAASDWLVEAGEREVVVPFARAVADRVPYESVRMRRDFEQILTVVQTLSFMHQRRRPRDGEGRVVATGEDYANAHRLLAKTMAVTLDRVSDAARETVDAVERLNAGGGAGVSYQRLADELGLSRSGAHRRVQPLLEDGYLANTEDRAGYPARLVTGDPLPDDRAVLPDPDTLPPLQNPPKPAQRLNASGESPATAGETTLEDPDSTAGGG